MEKRHDETCMFCGADNNKSVEYCRTCDTKLSEAKAKADSAIARFMWVRKDKKHSAI